MGDAGLGLMIPMMMLAGPLAGYGLGWLLQQLFRWGQWIIIVMVLLGVVAGMRESIVIMKKISHNQR